MSNGLDVACPNCGAESGQPCTVMGHGGRRPRQSNHVERVVAERAAGSFDTSLTVSVEPGGEIVVRDSTGTPVDTFENPAAGLLHVGRAFLESAVGFLWTLDPGLVRELADMRECELPTQEAAKALWARLAATAGPDDKAT